MAESRPEIPEEARERLDTGRCLNCGKKIKGRTIRGCDEACHRQIKRAIEKGETTEAMAIANGILAPAKPGGRHRRDGTKLSELLDNELQLSDDEREEFNRVSKKGSAEISRSKRTRKKKSRRNTG